MTESISSYEEDRKDIKLILEGLKDSYQRFLTAEELMKELEIENEKD